MRAGTYCVGSPAAAAASRKELTATATAPSAATALAALARRGAPRVRRESGARAPLNADGWARGLRVPVAALIQSIVTAPRQTFLRGAR